MGLTGYYRRFIQGFSKIAYPITSLQKKGVKSISSLKCQESFENIKILLTMAPILKWLTPIKTTQSVHMLVRRDWGEYYLKKGMWYVMNLVN